MRWSWVVYRIFVTFGSSAHTSTSEFDLLLCKDEKFLGNFQEGVSPVNTTSKRHLGEIRSDKPWRVRNYILESVYIYSVFLHSLSVLERQTKGVTRLRTKLSGLPAVSFS